jgi:hypothetical protein
MNTKIILAGVAAVVVFLFHMFTNPLLSASSAKEALINGDGEKLAAMIDFPALREDLKADLMKEMGHEDNPVVQGMGGAMMSGVIDTFVQPEELAAMVSTGQITEDDFPKDFDADFGLTRFVVSIVIEGQPVEIEFAPRGLRWKIVGANFDMDGLSGL